MPDCYGRDANNYACYPTMPADDLKALLPNFSQSNAQCAGRHQSGQSFCAHPTADHPSLGCCRPPQALGAFCGESEDNKAALILLDNICSKADSGHGGGYCAGDFNWGPGGVQENIISQVDAWADDLWPKQAGTNPAYGLNCAVVPDQASGKYTCKYNRLAAVDAAGNIMYKNFGWDLDGMCGGLQKEDCQKVTDAFGLCAWQENADGGQCGPGNLTDPHTLTVPVCMASRPESDCAEAADGKYCYMYGRSDRSLARSLGKCDSGDCVHL
jgi:hypothetical protein